MSGQQIDRQLSALGRTLQILRDEQSKAAQIDHVIAHLDAEFDYSLIWIGLYDRTTQKVLGQGGRSPTGDIQLLTQDFALTPGELLEQVIVQQRPAGLPNLKEEFRAGRWQKIAQRLGIQGTLVFPIRCKDTCFGVALLGVTYWGVPAQSSDKARLSMLFGELGAALHRVDMAYQRSQIKQTAAPLLSLLSELSHLPSVESRLTAITRETHQFIGASRTYIYWLDYKTRLFRHRTGQPGSQRVTKTVSSRPTLTPPAQISISEVGPFYQSLTANSPVSISEADSALQTENVGQLMQKIQSQAFAAAPILFQGELLGFLGVDNPEPRLWTGEEKAYLCGAAQLASLVAPMDGTEQVLTQIQQNQALVAEVSHAIYSRDDWNQVLKECSDRLVERLNVQQIWVLAYREQQERFTVVYERAGGKPALDSPLATLNKIDWQMLEHSQNAVSVEDLDDDLKLMAWRDAFLNVGVRSLLVCHTAIGSPLRGLLVIGDQNTRVWNSIEQDLLRAAGQQIGLVLRQFQLHGEIEQQQQIYDSIQSSLDIMQDTQDLSTLEQTTVNHIAALLQVPLAALITWIPGQAIAQVAAIALSDHRFHLHADAQINIQADPLTQRVLQHPDIVPLSREHLSLETRRWLSGQDIGQILTVALRTASDHRPCGLLLVADGPERAWLERQRKTLEILSGQLAWARRYLIVSEALTARREQLELLNWYKHRRLERLYQALGQQVEQLNELSHQKDTMASLRYHQIIRELGSLLKQTQPVLRDESWQVRPQDSALPLATLLKRARERIEPHVQEGQLWVQVHNKHTLDIGSDPHKIELVLHEALACACERSPQKSRLDIWCRPLDFHWLEISVTDQGSVPPALLEALQNGRELDLLAPSPLDHPPGLHLGICQALMQQVGGEFNLYRLDDGRTVSRLLVPINTGIEA
ncbi:MAG: GAF domain-containing protein [Elainellaceae cyanobacterium]